MIAPEDSKFRKSRAPLAHYETHNMKQQGGNLRVLQLHGCILIVRSDEHGFSPHGELFFVFEDLLIWIDDTATRSTLHGK